MNINTSDFKRAFKGYELDLEALRRALIRDDTIVPCLIRLLEYRLAEQKFNLSDLDKDNYTHRRDIETGREFELRKLLTKLTEPTPAAIIKATIKK